MAKVKKRTAVTGVRNAKAASTTGSTPTVRETRSRGTVTTEPKAAKRAMTAKEPAVVKKPRVAKKKAVKKPGVAKAPKVKAPKMTTAQASKKKRGTVGPRSARNGTNRKGTKMSTRAKTGRAASLQLLKKKGRPAPPPPVVRVSVRELDPVRKCGAGTSVQLLFRVDETVDGRSTAHLVFLDRHGWYCEHGRNCPAVGHAKKYNGQIARVS